MKSYVNISEIHLAKAEIEPVGTIKVLGRHHSYLQIAMKSEQAYMISQ